MKVHRYIVDKIESGEKLHFTLIDPDKGVERVEEISEEMASAGTDAFLVGGSLAVTPEEAFIVAKTLKKHGLPVIVFPGNINCLTREADAVLYMILLNTHDPYYLFGAQLAAAPIIRKYGLETLPTGYLVVYPGTAVAHVGRVIPIPENKPEITAAYAMACEMLGLKYIYLEAGSGSVKPIPTSFVRAVKSCTDNLIVITGGGIRDPETARKLVSAGADIIVTGTVVEESIEKATRIIKAIKTG